jgi:hypothetical protein
MGSSTLHFRPHLLLIFLLACGGILALSYSTLTGRKRSRTVIADHSEVATLVIRRAIQKTLKVNSKDFKVLSSEIQQARKPGSNGPY